MSLAIAIDAAAQHLRHLKQQRRALDGFLALENESGRAYALDKEIGKIQDAIISCAKEAGVWVGYLGETCMDGGTCHHECADRCFRREGCVPLTQAVGDGLTIAQWRYPDAAPQAVQAAVPNGWREQFAAAVYEDLAAADNQDVPLEEYPARILKVMDSIVGPRHPTVVKWRNDAIRNCIAIARKYCRDPESHKYLQQDLDAMLATDAAPAHPAEEVPAQAAVPVVRGEVLVTVSGFTGSGKSAIAGEIEIMCRALGLQVEWPDGVTEKNMTHADWTTALELYNPRVRIIERNVPRNTASGADQ
jgi:hypothetical protein